MDARTAAEPTAAPRPARTTATGPARPWPWVLARSWPWATPRSWPGVLARAGEAALRSSDAARYLSRATASVAEVALVAIARSRPVDRAVDLQVRRVVAELVPAVLDDVLRLLEAEPERVQALIRGQREGMVDEFVQRLRGAAVGGDARAGRLTRRLVRRPTPPGTTTRS